MKRVARNVWRLAYSPHVLLAWKHMNNVPATSLGASDPSRGAAGDPREVPLRALTICKIWQSQGEATNRAGQVYLTLEVRILGVVPLLLFGARRGCVALLGSRIVHVLNRNGNRHGGLVPMRRHLEHVCQACAWRRRRQQRCTYRTLTLGGTGYRRFGSAKQRWHTKHRDGSCAPYTTFVAT